MQLPASPAGNTPLLLLLLLLLTHITMLGRLPRTAPPPPPAAPPRKVAAAAAAAERFNVSPRPTAAPVLLLDLAGLPLPLPLLLLLLLLHLLNNGPTSSHPLLALPFAASCSMSRHAATACVSDDALLTLLQ
jgi:hypothetical protein